MTSVALLAWFTTWVIVLEVLVAKLLLALYDAVIECVATDKAEPSHAARPLLSTFTVLQIVVVPSLNVTVPVFTVAVLGAFAVTVAVKVSDCPKTEGVTPELSANVVVVL